MEKTYFAAIDLGSNSCRIKITDEHKNTVFRNSSTVKLGEGVALTNRFSDEAMERTLKCLFEYKQMLNKYNVQHMRAIATAACRTAENGAEFVKAVFSETRINLEVIDGKEEAKLNLVGAVSHVKDQSKYVLVYDMGGGSTEITLAKNSGNYEIINTISIPLGSRNATEKFLLTEYDEEKAKRLHDEISSYVAKFAKDCDYKKYAKETKAVSTSSTPLRLASMVNKFGKYERDRSDGLVFKTSESDDIIKEVYKMSCDDRINNPYMGHNRGPIFISACIIFKAIYDGLNLTNITASLQASQEAIIEDLIKKWQK